MRLFYLILFTASLLFSQAARENPNIQEMNPVNWGEKIRLGSTFTTTDSTRLFRFNVDDSAYTAGDDTLFSDALPMLGDYMVGIYNVVAYAEALGDLSANLDSIRIDVRYGEDFTYDTEATGETHKIVWDYNTSTSTGWRDIMQIATGVKEELYISQADSSWNTPHYMRQYRVIVLDADVDTSRIWLTDYVR